MRNTYEVGVGFFKHNFLDAVQKAKSGDTIIVSEGFYELPELLEVTESISIVAKDLKKRCGEFLGRIYEIR